MGITTTINIRICGFCQNNHWGIECCWGSDLPPILPLTWSPLALVQCKWDLLYQWSPTAHSHTCLFTTSMIWSLWWFWDITNSQTSNPVDFDVLYVASLNFHQPRQEARLIERWLGPMLILYFVSCDAFTYYTMPSMIRLSVSPQWTIEHWPPLQLCAHMFSFTQPTHALSMMIDCSLSNALKNISTALWPFLGGALRNYKDPFLIFSFDQTLQEWEVMCS